MFRKIIVDVVKKYTNYINIHVSNYSLLSNQTVNNSNRHNHDNHDNDYNEVEYKPHE